MARNESKKLPLILFLISLSLHLFVFAASSHEYVWRERAKKSRPIKFRVVSVEKPKEKLPPNPQSRFLSNANRKESGSGNPGETPRLRRESKDQIPARRGGLGPKTASLSPASESRVPAPPVPPARPASPAVVKPKPKLEKLENTRERKPSEISESEITAKPIAKANLAPKPKPSVKTPSPAIPEKVQPKAKPPTDKKPERKKIEVEAIPKTKRKAKPAVRKKTEKKVAKKKPREKNKKAEAKKKTKEKVELAALKSAPKPKAFMPSDIPVRPKSPVVVKPKPAPEKAEKSKERKSPETSETTETPRPTETASLAPKPKPSVKAPSSVIQDKIKPKVKPMADKKPEKKKIEVEAVSNQKLVPKQAVKKKTINQVVKGKPREKNKKAEAKKKTKEKVELAALKPVTRSIQPRRPAPKQPQPKDPLALFRVKPQPRRKPKLPKFDLSDEEADRIAKKSLLDKNLEKEGGETISLDTRDFRYASYFAHIKRRIQNAWIWPVEAQKNRGELLLRFKLRKNGTLEEVRLIKSAGIRILDDLAMAAVTKAAPFEPFPEGLERKSITATFVYE